jgi:hypothetical protein
MEAVSSTVSPTSAERYGPIGADPLLEPKHVRVEVERLVLVADEHTRVEDPLQHRRSSGGRGHSPMTRGEQQT